MNKKYKLTKNTKEWCGTNLYQIEALVSFGSVAKGELGGWIEKEENLSVYGDAWVYGDARVYGNARVYGKLKLEAGLFFGVKWSGEKVQEVEIENGNYLIYKGEAKFGEKENEQKTELLKKADELLAKAQELKEEAEKL